MTADFENSKFQVLKIKTPLLRKLNFEDVFDSYAAEIFEMKKDAKKKRVLQKDLLEFMDYAWNHSQISEVLNWVLLRVSEFDDEFLYAHKHTLFGWTKRIENWWHSDYLSSLFARIVEFELRAVTEQALAVDPMLQTNLKLQEAFSPKIKSSKKKTEAIEIDQGTLRRMLPRLKTLQQMIQWNQKSGQEYSWFRRQSLVSLLYYSRLRRVVLPCEFLLEMVAAQLEDEDYYVQKAVGWTLREIYNIYPQRVTEFLQANVDKVSSHAWQAASEKLGLRVKKKLLALR